MTEILQVNNLTKYYGKIRAVDNLSLSVKKGDVYGILGPNGSGKTTTLAIISGIIKPQKGNYKWFNKPFEKSIKQKIGSLVEIPYFYPYLNLSQNLKIISYIKNVPENDIDRVLGLTNLLERKNSRYDNLSLGMKQRLGIASILLGDPEVMVLDEPANGLDPEGIAEVRELIKSEAQKNKTIILASHILDEVEKVCSHVGVLKSGQLIACGKVNELLTTDDLIIISANKLDEIYQLLLNSELIKSIEKDKDEISLTLKEKYSPADVNEFAFKNGIVLSKVSVKKKSLESQFLELVK